MGKKGLKGDKGIKTDVRKGQEKGTGTRRGSEKE